MHIGSMVMDIIMRSPDVLAKIGAGRENKVNEFCEGVFQPMLAPMVHYKDSSIEVSFKTHAYKGGADAKYEFDYYFADAGKNVDVLGYDVKMSNMQVFLEATSKHSVDKYTNVSGTITKPDVMKGINHENKTQEKLLELVEKTINKGGSGDIAIFSANSSYKKQVGYNNYEYDRVPGVKLASDSLADWHACINMSPTFEIRGHKQLFEHCISKPTEVKGIVHGDGIYVKVNVFMPDSREQSGKRQFFYTGYYRVLSITNTFSSGKFTQHLGLIAHQKT
jgi:hypothetical protein